MLKPLSTVGGGGGGGNPFDQDLNTTDDVAFNEVLIGGAGRLKWDAGNSAISARNAADDADRGFFGSYFFTAATGFRVNAGRVMHESNRKFFLGNSSDDGASAIQNASDNLIGWKDNATVTSGSIDTAIGRNAAGVMEINNGTAGTIRDVVARRHYVGAVTVFISSGSGTPEGAVTAPVGSLFLRTDGATSTTLYVKTSGTTATGWTAK